MSPVVRIPESTYSRLQNLATPFTDTPATVIERLLDLHEKEIASKGTSPTRERNTSGGPPPEGVRVFDPDAPDDLRFTRVIKAQLGEEEIKPPQWKELVCMAHIVAIRELGFSKVSALGASQIVEGKLEERGYSYLPEVDISIQGQSAPNAWQSALVLAKALSLPVDVSFQWHTNSKAAYPGERGRLVWEPNAFHQPNPIPSQNEVG